MLYLCIENNDDSVLFSENKHNYLIIYYRIFAKINISDKFSERVRNFSIDTLYAQYSQKILPKIIRCIGGVTLYF